MKIISARFIKSAVKPKQYPDLGLPEFAFFGKSNTGKSSLINMLVNKPGLVKTGARPGMTREVNFFVVNEAFCLVDLPGYGYAKVSKDIQKGFSEIPTEYCSNRTNLKTVFFLMDLRRVPTEQDEEVLKTLQTQGVPIALVGTKSDKLSRNELNQSLMAWAKIFDLDPKDVFVTSSSKKVGGLNLLRLISEQIRGDSPQI